MQNMTSKEDTTSFPHVDAQERRERQRRTPKHLEDYILAYHHRGPAPSSQLNDGVHEEQKGAAAAADSGQADASIRLGNSRASRSPSPGDPLSTTSLKQLMESISKSEMEERDEIAQVTNKLCEYEQRQRRRRELLEHITSFLREEEENDEKKKMMKGTTSPLIQSHSPLHAPSYIHSSINSPSAEKQVRSQWSHTERHQLI